MCARDPRIELERRPVLHHRAVGLAAAGDGATEREPHRRVPGREPHRGRDLALGTGLIVRVVARHAALHRAHQRVVLGRHRGGQRRGGLQRALERIPAASGGHQVHVVRGRNEREPALAHQHHHVVGVHAADQPADELDAVHRQVRRGGRGGRGWRRPRGAGVRRQQREQSRDADGHQGGPLAHARPPGETASASDPVGARCADRKARADRPGPRLSHVRSNRVRRVSDCAASLAPCAEWPRGEPSRCARRRGARAASSPASRSRARPRRRRAPRRPPAP